MNQEKLNDILLGAKFEKEKMDALTMEELMEVHTVALYCMMKNKNEEKKSKFFQSRAKVFYMLILERLTTAGELFILFSKATRLPYVVCDEKTFDDQIYLFLDEQQALDAAKKDGADDKTVIRVENKQIMSFYLSLYSIGVNAIIVNISDKTMRVQLKELCKEPDYSKIPEEKRPVVNPQLQLTSIYYVQEMRRQQQSGEKKDLSDMLEEMNANLRKGKFFLMYRKREEEDASEEGKQIEFPTIKLKNGQLYHPIFTDLNEALKFPNARSFHPMITDLKGIFKVLAPQVAGVILNPQSVQIIVTKEIMKKDE